MIYPYDSLIDEKRVLCGACALSRVGLVDYNSGHLELMTNDIEFDNFSLCYITYYYYSKIDYENYVAPLSSNPFILVPTKERAIVEYIKNEKWCDEGILIEALKSYLMWFRNDEELYKVAEHFKVPKETIDYWINEALTDEEI